MVILELAGALRGTPETVTSPSLHGSEVLGEETHLLAHTLAKLYLIDEIITADQPKPVRWQEVDDHRIIFQPETVNHEVFAYQGRTRPTDDSELSEITWGNHLLQILTGALLYRLNTAAGKQLQYAAADIVTQALTEGDDHLSEAMRMRHESRLVAGWMHELDQQIAQGHIQLENLPNRKARPPEWHTLITPPAAAAIDQLQHVHADVFVPGHNFSYEDHTQRQSRKQERVPQLPDYTISRILKEGSSVNYDQVKEGLDMTRSEIKLVEYLLATTEEDGPLRFRYGSWEEVLNAAIKDLRIQDANQFTKSAHYYLNTFLIRLQKARQNPKRQPFGFRRFLDSYARNRPDLRSATLGNLEEILCQRRDNSHFSYEDMQALLPAETSSPSGRKKRLLFQDSPPPAAVVEPADSENLEALTQENSNPEKRAAKTYVARRDLAYALFSMDEYGFTYPTLKDLVEELYVEALTGLPPEEIEAKKRSYCGNTRQYCQLLLGYFTRLDQGETIKRNNWIKEFYEAIVDHDLFNQLEDEDLLAVMRRELSFEELLKKTNLTPEQVKKLGPFPPDAD